MLRGGKGEEGCHKCGQTHRQTETDVNPTSRYSTGFSIQHDAQWTLKELQMAPFCLQLCKVFNPKPFLSSPTSWEETMQVVSDKF